MPKLQYRGVGKFLLVAVLGIGLAWWVSSSAAETARIVPPPAADETASA